MTFDPYKASSFPSSPRVGEQAPSGLAKRHSGLGISSFLLALLGGGSSFGILILAGVLETTTPGGLDEESPIAMMIGLGIVLAFLANLVGAAIGVASLFQANCSKTFGIIGLILNCLAVLFVAFVIVLGIMTEA